MKGDLVTQFTSTETSETLLKKSKAKVAQQSHKGYRSYFTLVISVQLILAFICLSAKAVLAKIRSPVVLATLKLMVIHLGKVADASTHNKMDRVNLGLMFGQVQNLFSVT